MKILRVVTSMNPAHGGVVEAINLIAANIYKTGSEMEVLCFDSPNEKWIIENKIYGINAIGKSKTPYGINFRYFYWLWEKATNYDVVILDGLWQFHVIGGFLLKYLNIPYYVYTHGMLDPYFNANKLKYFKKLPFWFLIERNILALSKAVIFTCEEEMLLAKTSFPWFKATSKVAALGVNLPNSPEDKLSSIFYNVFPELKNKRVVLFLSRINKKKGCDLLIEAFAKVCKQDVNLHLLMAGPDQIGWTSSLQAQAKRLGIAERITWPGMLTGDLKWGAFYAAEIFCLPSHQENFGIVVAEALACAKPVLISNKVNIWREIEAAGAGFVADDTLAGTITNFEHWLRLSPYEFQNMKLQTTACFAKHFHAQRAAERLFEIIRGNAK